MRQLMSTRLRDLPPSVNGMLSLVPALLGTDRGGGAAGAAVDSGIVYVVTTESDDVVHAVSRPWSEVWLGPVPIWLFASSEAVALAPSLTWLLGSPELAMRALANLAGTAGDTPWRPRAMSAVRLTFSCRGNEEVRRRLVNTAVEAVGGRSAFVADAPAPRRIRTQVFLSRVDDARRLAGCAPLLVETRSRPLGVGASDAGWVVT